MRRFFGFTKEPFSPDVRVDELFHAPVPEGAKERCLYAVNLGAISVITGDAGPGKSTALRYAASALHPSPYQIIPVVASTGSIIEVLKQIAMALDIEWGSIALAKLTRIIRMAITEIGRYRYRSLMKPASYGSRSSPSSTPSASSNSTRSRCFRSYWQDRTTSSTSSCTSPPGRWHRG